LRRPHRTWNCGGYFPNVYVEQAAMRYQFLVESYETERTKVVSVWSMFRDDDLTVRPGSLEARGRSVHEQMVHQCVSEDHWFLNIPGIDFRRVLMPFPETRPRSFHTLGSPTIWIY
jgi:hypothetical protein